MVRDKSELMAAIEKVIALNDAATDRYLADPKAALEEYAAAYCAMLNAMAGSPATPSPAA